ncbi:hypothetical protein ASG29_05035 [Sphingomonas sp. Leaf412]|uniref:hypothetical protein n=1 Tax=Sphingomonas sp. Leaf412 TaxID=1736370 RepID=UPI000701FC81|nr:hypothetical protein [Sphingomonas sp. Leaf412]KQT33420.1 hypothetical protein ASG29_05035 [Sphingomonas sp. Leaf412]
MGAGRSIVVAGAAMVLAACTHTKQMADTGFVPPEGSYRLVVMRPDVSVGSITTGGGFEPREEWTTQARANLVASIERQQVGRGGAVTIVSTRAQAGADPARVADLERLHAAVGRSIATHKYAGLKLPTKKDRFDWTLGRDAVAYGQATGYDYALFVRAQDSFASTGRVAVQAVAFLGCMVGVCLMPGGGRQEAFASLVDLKTGRVVWFNTLSSGSGDIREQDGADRMVANLLGRMKPGRDAKGDGDPRPVSTATR